MPLGPSCPNHPFSTEPGSMKINTQVRGPLAPRINPNLGSGPVPLRKRVHSLRISLLGLALSCLRQPPFLNVGIPVQGLGCTRSAPWGVPVPVEAARWEACRAYNKWLCSRRLGRWVEGDTKLACLVLQLRSIKTSCTHSRLV
jgi:hypothetical protein